MLRNECSRRQASWDKTSLSFLNIVCKNAKNIKYYKVYRILNHLNVNIYFHLCKIEATNCTVHLNCQPIDIWVYENE